MIKSDKLLEEFQLIVEAQDWNLLRSWFKLEVGPEELVDKIIIWGRFFMKDYFYDPSPEFHRDLIRAFFSPSNEFIAAPRGFSKTSIAQLCIAYICANSLKKFIVLLEKSFTEASEVLDGVRTVFADNGLIKMVYGSLIGKLPDSDSKDRDARGDLIINEVRLRGKGFDSPVRGMKYNQYRPDLIVLDDCETDEHIESVEQRIKNLKKYNKAVVPALSIDGSIKVFGTILHFDSLLNNLIKWHKGRIYRAYDPHDPKTSLLWPERWTFDRLQQKKADMESMGRSSNAFSQEYLNDPVDEEARVFKQSWLWDPSREYTMDQIAEKKLLTFAAIDPAYSKNEGSDYTGIVVVGIDNEDNWYILHTKRMRVDVKELLDVIFFNWQRWGRFGLTKIGLAKNAFEDQVKPLLKEEMRRRQSYPIVEELKEMGRNKEDRIKGALQGRAELGKLWFLKDDLKGSDDTELLRYELYEFPSSQHDDLADCLAFISSMRQNAGGGVSRGKLLTDLAVPDFSSAARNVTGA